MVENFFGITNTGRIRDNNEDAFIADKLSNGWIVACVIDGVGGYEGGEVAAEIARETIWKKLQQLSADPVQTLKEGVLQANQNIYQEKLHDSTKNQMACVLTIALVDVESNQFYYAHIGDTRLYLLRDQTLVKVTKDHSFVGFLEDSGRLTEKEAMQHPKRNEINKALGFDPQIDVKSDYIETGSSPFLPGDMLLLCSDGLSDLVNKKDMTAVLLSRSSLEEKGQALIDAANVAGGKDNITVVIVHNNKKPLKIKATKPVASKKNGSNEEREPVTQQEKMVTAKEDRTPLSPRRKSNALIWGLGLLCLLLASLCVWLWSRNKPKEKPQSFVAQYTPNAAEKELSDSLGFAKGTFLLSTQNLGAPVIIGDTIYVRQDTLHINGNGAVLQADSSFAGPALIITNNNRVLSLENLVFKNFATAILLQNKGVQLKNVQFLNCKVPVQHQLFLPADSALNGIIRDSFIVSHTSVPK
jgi:serine/threonine protein phosphatase PrpC